MSAVTRRVIYVLLYEVFAVLFTALFFMLFGHEGPGALIVGIVSSIIAVIWNYIWNTIFEYWESKQASKERTPLRRIVLAIGFEGGLVLFLVPAVALILQLSLVEAFLLELGVLIFFLIYTYLFSWLFDLVFPPIRKLESKTQEQ